MMREVVITMQPAEASAMQRNNSVVGSHSAKRMLHLVGLDEYGEHRNVRLNIPQTVMETDPTATLRPIRQPPFFTSAFG
jgi:hypothetical protein